MKFIWSEPPKHDNECSFPRLHWEEPIFGWLKFNDVWFEPNTYERKHYELSYNYLYHFFDITIYEHEANCGKGEPDNVIQAMRTYLKSTNLKWSESSDYCWTRDGKRIPGVRFWIDAEKV